MQRKQIKNYIASPLNYIGGKARILDQMLPYMPASIDIFVDLFWDKTSSCHKNMSNKTKYLRDFLSIIFFCKNTKLTITNNNYYFFSIIYKVCKLFFLTFA